MDKIQIFKDLSVKDLREDGYDKYSAILGDYYSQFTSFCDFLQGQCKEIPGLESHIEGMECSINDTGAEFEIHLSDGDSKTIHFVDQREMINKGEGRIIYHKSEGYRTPYHHPSIQEVERREEEQERLEEEAKLKAHSKKRASKKK